MAESGPLSPFLSADRPITSLDEDRLSRKHFAINIAKIFHEWKGRDSLVVAVYGHWGSGKTSLKNLILRALDDLSKSSDSPTQVLQFNPWEWTGHSELTQAFFNEIGKTLRHSTGNHTAVRAAKILRSYSALLSTAKAILEGLPKLFVSLLMLVGAMGFGASISQGLHDWGPVLGALSFGALTIAGILGLSESMLTHVSAWVSAQHDADTKTLSELKKVLSETDPALVSRTSDCW